MKRILLVVALSVTAYNGSNAQQATGRTTPGAVGIVIESPVDSSQLQPFLSAIRQKPGSAKAAEAHLSIAKLQFANKAYNAALQDLRNIVQVYPKGNHSAEAAYYLTAALVRTQHFEEAITEASNALTLYPGGRWNDGIQYYLGAAHYALGQNDLALAQLNSVVDGHPNSIFRDDALKLVAHTFKRSRQYDRAIQPLRRIAAESKEKGRRTDAQLEIGWLHSMNGQVEAAIAEYQKAAALDASVAARAGYETANIHLHHGNYEKAREEFYKVAERYPADPFGARASFRVGYCLAESGEYQSALQQLARTDAAYPNFEQRDLLLWHKAISYKGLDQLEQNKLAEQAKASETDTTRSADSTRARIELSKHLVWYKSILEKRIEHLGNAKVILQELVASYPKSALVKAADAMLVQTEDTMKELEAEKAKTEEAVKQIEAGKGKSGG